MYMSVHARPICLSDQDKSYLIVDVHMSAVHAYGVMVSHPAEVFSCIAIDDQAPTRF